MLHGFLKAFFSLSKALDTDGVFISGNVIKDEKYARGRAKEMELIKGALSKVPVVN